ncbi:MAG: AAA family ATPase [Candidatus Bipolaricaulia bacterium]
MICWRDLLGELPEPWLVMVCGLVGVGKTTIARQIARELRARYLSTDRVGYRLFGNRRSYDDEYYRRVYEHMIARAQLALSKRRSVVLDGTFLRHETRQRFFAEFREHASLWVIYVTCPEEIVRARLEARRDAPLPQRGYSDGRYEIYQAMKEKLSDGWSDPRSEKISFVTVDTALGEAQILEVRTKTLNSELLTENCLSGGW